MSSNSFLKFQIPKLCLKDPLFSFVALSCSRLNNLSILDPEPKMSVVIQPDEKSLLVYFIWVLYSRMHLTQKSNSGTAFFYTSKEES